MKRGAHLGLLVMFGCGAAATRRPAPGLAHVTSDDQVMAAHVPGDPELVLYLHAARLRENPRLAAFAQALSPTPLARTDALLLASYDLGSLVAEAVTLVAQAEPPVGEGLAQPRALAPRLWALGPAALLAAPAVSARFTPAALRAAMPMNTGDAAVLVWAHLPWRVRRALSLKLGGAEVPERVAAWLDVRDDAALVVAVHLPGRDEAAWQREAQELGGLLQRVEPVLAAVQPGALAPWQRRSVTRVGAAVRVEVLWTPAELQRLLRGRL